LCTYKSINHFKVKLFWTLVRNTLILDWPKSLFFSTIAFDFLSRWPLWLSKNHAFTISVHFHSIVQWLARILRFSYHISVLQLLWFVFPNWFQKCPQKLILTNIPEVMLHFRWCTSFSAVLEVNLDLVDVYCLYLVIHTNESEHWKL
jgi:hypothetical protein